MTKLLALQHIACEPPAAYEDELRARGIGLERVELDEGDALPDWRGFDGLVVMGGPMGAYDQQAHPWLADEKRLIADACRRARPCSPARRPTGARPSCADVPTASSSISR